MKQVFYVVAIVFLCACTSNTIYKPPKNLIPKDSMVLLLEEMFIASSAYSEKNIKFQKNVHYMAFVYEKYGVDSSRFKTSNYYYTTLIGDYEKMLKEVKLRIEKKRDSIQFLKKKKDSILRDSLDRLKNKKPVPNLNKMKK